MCGWSAAPASTGSICSNPDQAKTYRDVDLAVAFVQDDFGYFGPITLVTELTADAKAPD